MLPTKRLGSFSILTQDKQHINWLPMWRDVFIGEVIISHKWQKHIIYTHRTLQKSPTTNPTIYASNSDSVLSQRSLNVLKLWNLTKRFCANLNLKIVCYSYKIKNIFSFKYTIPSILKSCVICKFSCAGM